MSAASRDMSYAAVMARKNEIMKASLGIDFADFEMVLGDVELVALDDVYAADGDAARNRHSVQ